jgi:hypothetical protein
MKRFFFLRLHIIVKLCPRRSVVVTEKKNISNQVPVAPVYNPSYSGGWDEEDGGSRPG